MPDQLAAASKTKRQAIEEWAYFIWEANGKPLGCELDHWLQAEAEIPAATKITEANSSNTKAAA